MRKGACPRTPAAGRGGSGRPQQPGSRPFAHPCPSVPPDSQLCSSIPTRPLPQSPDPIWLPERLPRPGDPIHATPSCLPPSTHTSAAAAGGRPRRHPHVATGWLRGELLSSGVPQVGPVPPPERRPNSEPSGACGAQTGPLSGGRRARSTHHLSRGVLGLPRPQARPPRRPPRVDAPGHYLGPTHAGLLGPTF